MAFVNSHSGLHDRVHFTGYASDEDVVALLNSTAALVFPSLWEGFGLPAVEAMSCGVPVLSSNRSSLPEVVGKAGLFYDPLDVEEIARNWPTQRYRSHENFPGIWVQKWLSSHS